MARSTETLNSLIIAEKEARTELQGLTSTSATSIWRLWSFITSAVLFTIETMFDLFRSEIETLLQRLKPGTLLWYQAMVKAFQYGDALSWLNMQFIYTTIDTSKQIVKQCAVNEGNQGLVIKVAKEVSGELEPLSQNEENALLAYLAMMKYAGTKISLVNSQANKLHVAATVYYDPLILKPDGSDITDATKPVEVAIKNYLRELPFNGRLKRTAIEASMLAVEGVADIQITILAHKYGSAAYVIIPISWIPESGYFKIDTSYPLSSTITYTPNV